MTFLKVWLLAIAVNMVLWGIVGGVAAQYECKEAQVQCP